MQTIETEAGVFSRLERLRDLILEAQKETGCAIGVDQDGLLMLRVDQEGFEAEAVEAQLEDSLRYWRDNGLDLGEAAPQVLR